MTTTSSNVRRASRPHRRTLAGLCLAIFMAWTGTVSAQLDPLLFVKRIPPTVIIVVDTSFEMLMDGTGKYYDPYTYVAADDVLVTTGLGALGATTYRRIYNNMTFDDAPGKYKADSISVVRNTDSSYASFYANTRLEVLKSGIDLAVRENAGPSYRWGLVKLRQANPAWRAAGNCDKPVLVSNLLAVLFFDLNPCNVGLTRFGVYAPSITAPNYSIEGVFAGGAHVVPASAGSASAMLSVVRRPIGDNSGLIPAGLGASTHGDRPLAHALDDARAAAVAAMDADSDINRACRNTVVVLLTAGRDDGNQAYRDTHNAGSVASTFLNVSSNGTTKRVPIHVVGIRPPAAHEAQLQTIATNSGGRYVKATTSADIASAINYAVQAGFARATNFDTSTVSEFLPVSPVVGTVNLKNARNSAGTSLPNSNIQSNPGGAPLEQRSNVMLSAGFSLPGFEGVLRAFRVYRPEEDTTKATGWKFVNDGTKLWPDLDSRPSLAGRARVPKDPATRNVFTYLPNGSGGGSVVAFTTSNEVSLRPHMNLGTGVTANDLITLVRAQPLGAVIGSTPAILEPPSLDPAPDSDYGLSSTSGTFAATYKNRRAIIFVGGNNGMIHAIDARTGFELWAFIPYNLLPKLRTLLDGQPMERFDYFVDSSPKLAEVKLNGSWRSLLLIGEGAGGTFYQAFDVTEAGMGVAPEADDLSAVNSLLQRFDTPNESISFKWAFPNYSSFDPTYTAEIAVADGTPGGVLKLFGDLKSSATQAEKTVGFTWSDPAVGPLDASRSTNAVIVGSGYFPDVETQIPNRGDMAPKAGNAFYLLDARTGTLIGGSSSCTEIQSDAGSGTGCVSIGDVANGRKNALQADPAAASEMGSTGVSRAYLGDVDGKFWRFSFTSSGSISATTLYDAEQPIYGSSALLFIGTADVYSFFSTGSDLLAASAPGGSGTFRLLGLKDNTPGSGASVTFEKALAATTDVGGRPDGERPSAAPSVAGDIVFFSTTTENGGDPCSDFTGRLYAFTFMGGAAYDTDGSGRIESTESAVVKSVAGRVTSPFIVDQHLYLGTSGATGANIEAFGDPEDFNNGVGQVGVRILSWREVR